MSRQRTSDYQALHPVYLVHSKKWPLARALMLADGLHALVTLFTAENLYLRSQVWQLRHPS